MKFCLKQIFISEKPSWNYFQKWKNKTYLETMGFSFLFSLKWKLNLFKLSHRNTSPCDPFRGEKNDPLFSSSIIKEVQVVLNVTEISIMLIHITEIYRKKRIKDATITHAIHLLVHMRPLCEIFPTHFSLSLCSSFS